MCISLHLIRKTFFFSVLKTLFVILRCSSSVMLPSIIHCGEFLFDAADLMDGGPLMIGFFASRTGHAGGLRK